MRFEIEGDIPAILNILETYKEVFNTEYKRQVQVAKEKLRIIGMADSVNSVPDEFDMFFWEENGKVIIRIPVYTPIILKVLKKDKKMAENFKKFIEFNGVYVKSVKHTGD